MAAGRVPMSVGLAEKSMARPKGRPKKPGGEGKQVRIESDLVTMAQYVTSRNGKPLIEYLSEILRPTIERDFRKAGKELEKNLGIGDDD
jgi:hypothetical protein